jgi:2,4-dienoyl-CoA reductase-like NADH-dependent reductase (Old Yellow Enzyme family)
MVNLEYLLQEIKIKSMLLKNRVVMPPMGTGLGRKDGTVSEATLAYFKRRVESGAGLYITEISSVHPRGSVSPSALRIYDDSYIDGLSQLANITHQAGSKIAIQLHHAGRESFYQLNRGQAMAPSAIPSYVFGGSPQAMSREEIQEVVQAFGSAARRAVEAGFDAVELHAAHGYLLQQFLSIHSNQREDEYGGSMENRARFILECIQEVRAQVGPDFPISLRISAEEVIKNGYSIEEMQGIVPEFVKAGVDIIHASFGTHGSPGGIIQAPIEYEQGFNVHLARKIKEKVDIPVIGVGRFSDPVIMNEAIKRGDADLIAVGRQHLADPDFLKNAQAGHPERTFYCLACNQGCIERLIYEAKPVRCAINPETGQELYYPSQPAAKKRQVWIIGGGPAGLTAAAEAARLGHQVTLLDPSIYPCFLSLQFKTRAISRATLGFSAITSDFIYLPHLLTAKISMDETADPQSYYTTAFKIGHCPVPTTPASAPSGLSQDQYGAKEVEIQPDILWGLRPLFPFHPECLIFALPEPHRLRVRSSSSCPGSRPGLPGAYSAWPHWHFPGSSS